MFLCSIVSNANPAVLDKISNWNTTTFDEYINAPQRMHSLDFVDSMTHSLAQTSEQTFYTSYLSSICIENIIK